MSDRGLPTGQRGDASTADRAAVEELRQYVAAAAANGTLLLSDAARARAIISDAAPGDKALRNALIALVDLRVARTLQSPTVTPQALTVLSARLQGEQGISEVAAERAVRVLAAVFAPQVFDQPPTPEPSSGQHPVPDRPLPPTYVAHPSFPTTPPPPPLPLPPRPWWTRPAFVVVAVLVLLAATVGVIVYVTQNDKSPTAQSTSLPPSDTSPPARGLSADEQALANRLPNTMVDATTCRSNSGNYDSTQVYASVACTPVEHSVAASLIALDFNGISGQTSYVSARSLPTTTGTCAATTESRSNDWRPTTNSPKAGTIYCYTTSASTDELAWTYDDTAFMLIALAAPGHTHAELFQWWTSQAELVLN